MSKKTALIIMFCILGVLLVFHTLIYTEQIPYDKVWAGRLKSLEEMKKFEMVSLLVNAYILMILFIKYRLLAQGRENKWINLSIWAIAGFFLLNTVGNLFAESQLEMILGGLVTIVSCVLCVIIARKENNPAKA
jgi:NADH:ubiquinone oxidoreductase subunit 2 (subunit N)